VQPANVSWSLNVVSLKPTNLTVKAGDRLGISLNGFTAVGYCRFEYDVATFDKAATTNGLFLNKMGQVSPRGKDGKAAPVFASSGKEIKWYRIVV
jgi:hypothetical protein